MKPKKRLEQLQARQRWFDTWNGGKDDGPRKRKSTGGYRRPGSFKHY